MTQENKELLLKDLCARLPYGVKIELMPITRGKCTTLTPIILRDYFIADDVSYLPYLRPMSSMTEEEKRELSAKYNWSIMGNDISIRYHSEGYWDDDTECPTNEYLKLFDWLNAHHFDYRGLIDLGLALVAPEGMYN